MIFFWIFSFLLLFCLLLANAVYWVSFQWLLEIYLILLWNLLWFFYKFQDGLRAIQDSSIKIFSDTIMEFNQSIHPINKYKPYEKSKTSLVVFIYPVLLPKCFCSRMGDHRNCYRCKHQKTNGWCIFIRCASKRPAQSTGHRKQ